MKLKSPTSFSTFQMSVVGFKSTKARHSQHHLYLDETVTCIRLRENRDKSKKFLRPSSNVDLYMYRT